MPFINFEEVEQLGRIGLVAHCMDIGQQDAAFFIAEQYGDSNSDSTVSKKLAIVPPKQEVGDDRPNSKSERNRDIPPAHPCVNSTHWHSRPSFSTPNRWSSSALRRRRRRTSPSASTRGQVYIPIRHSDGSISGFVGYADGQMKLPPK